MKFKKPIESVNLPFKTPTRKSVKIRVSPFEATEHDFHKESLGKSLNSGDEVSTQSLYIGSESAESSNQERSVSQNLLTPLKSAPKQSRNFKTPSMGKGFKSTTTPKQRRIQLEAELEQLKFSLSKQDEIIELESLVAKWKGGCREALVWLQRNHQEEQGIRLSLVEIGKYCGVYDMSALGYDVDQDDWDSSTK